jgi:hypothetical protein
MIKIGGKNEAECSLLFVGRYLNRNGMAKKVTSFVTSRGRKAGARASGGVFFSKGN